MLLEKGCNQSINAPGRNRYEHKEFHNQRGDADPVTKACRLTLGTLRLEIRRKLLEQFSNKGVEDQTNKSAKKTMNFIIMCESCH